MVLPTSHRSLYLSYNPSYTPSSAFTTFLAKPWLPLPLPSDHDSPGNHADHGVDVGGCNKSNPDSRG